MIDVPKTNERKNKIEKVPRRIVVPMIIASRAFVAAINRAGFAMFAVPFQPASLNISRGYRVCLGGNGGRAENWPRRALESCQAWFPATT